MPIYTVEGPNGKRYKIEGPEGATVEQLAQVIQGREQSAAQQLEADRKLYDPTNGMSTSEKFFAGVGKGMTDIGHGVGQIFGVVSRDDVKQKRETDRALMNTGAGKVGSVVGNAAIALPAAFAPGANTYLGASLIGGGLGLAQPSMSNDETLTNTALGVVGGAGGKWVGDKVVNTLIGSRLPNARSGAQATASSTGGNSAANASASGSVNLRGSGGGYNFGSVGDDASAGMTRMQRSIVERNPQFRLTPGQASGSRSLQQLEAKLESQPMTSGAFNQIKATNQSEINRRVADAIGVRADVVDSVTLDQAHRRVDRIYDMIRGSRDRPIDSDGFLNGLQNVEANYNGMLFTNGKPYSVIDHPLVSQLYNQASNGQMSARQLVDLSSKMGKAARSQMTSANGDRQLGMALNEVKDIVDDMVEAGLSGRTQRLFNQARGNYRNLMTIESNTGIVNPSTGNVSGATLANALARKDKAGFLLGRNESPMYDAARFAQAFKPIVGDSGTATRMPLPSPTDFVLSAPFNLATRAYTSAPVVNLAARASATSRNGIAPYLGLGMEPWLSRSTALGGGLLATHAN